MRRIGLNLFDLGVLGYAAFFDSSLSVERAIGMVSALWALEFAIMIGRNELVDMGGTNGMHVVYILISSALAAGSISEYSALFAKIGAVFHMVNAIFCASTPPKWRNFWLLPLEGDETANSLLTDFGLWFFSLAVFEVGLAWGVDPVQAFSYSRLAVLFRTFLMNFVTGAFKSMEMKQPLQIFWLIYHALITLGLFVELPEGQSTADE